MVARDGRDVSLLTLWPDGFAFEYAAKLASIECLFSCRLLTNWSGDFCALMVELLVEWPFNKALNEVDGTSCSERR